MTMETSSISSLETVVPTERQCSALLDSAWLLSQKSIRGRSGLACLIRPNNTVRILSRVEEGLWRQIGTVLALLHVFFVVLAMLIISLKKNESLNECCTSCLGPGHGDAGGH